MSSYTIIGIHGLSNKPPSELLRAWWLAAMREGLQRHYGVDCPDMHFELAYWADLMHPQGPLKPYPDGPTAGLDTDEFDLAPYVPLAPEALLPVYSPSFAASLEVVGREAVSGLIDAGTVLPGGRSYAEQVMQRKARDLHRYFRNESDRLSVQERLLSLVRKAYRRGHRIMLVAHSMGSIVAFDVLPRVGYELTHLSVTHWVTLGSPLGMGAVKRGLTARGLALQVPEAVARWTNFADVRDRVALDARLRSDFSPNSEGVEIDDRFVVNTYVNPSGVHNYHKIYGYLRAPEFVGTIKEFIGL